MSPEFINLLGGSAILVYSIEELSRSVQYLAGRKFRAWINTFAERSVAGVALGVLLSFLLSSSSAVTVMLVGLANSRLLTLSQVFVLTLGASIGTTFIVHLFAFRLSEYGLLLFATSVFVGSVSKSDRTQQTARAAMFLGLMFFAMKLIGEAGVALENNELFKYVLEYFKNQPSVSFFFAAAFTILVQSSAATIAFVMSLVSIRHGTVFDAIPWVLGANVGTAAPAFIAALKSGPVGKQAALGNLLCKVIGAAICYPLMNYLARASLWFGGNLDRQVATAHTLFNVGLTIIFLPFVSIAVRMVRKFIPEDTDRGPFRFHYLDPKVLQTPEVALAQAHREILHLSDTVEQMVERSIGLFLSGDQKEFEAIKAIDQVVDYLNKGIKLFLAKLSQNEMTPEQVQKEFELVLRTHDLESIGDIIDKNILELVRKTMKKGYTFSKEGWEEIVNFHSKVVECLRLSNAYFSSQDRAIYAKLMVLHVQIEDMVLDFTENHMQRLHDGVKKSLETSSVHLDLLGNFQRIADLAINFTRTRTGRGEVENAPFDSSN